MSSSSSDLSNQKESQKDTEDSTKQFQIPTFHPALRFFFAILANFITFLNFSSGVVAIVLTIIDPTNTQYMLWAARLILLAIIFDFSDGIPARLAKKEPGFFGTVVDSVADTFSFGFAPSIMIAYSYPFTTIDTTKFLIMEILSITIGVYFGICTIYRLIRFTKTPSKKWFRGVPAPGAGCAVALYFIIKLYLENILDWKTIITPIFGLLFIVFTGTTMIISLKYPTTKLRKTPIEIFLLGLAAVVILSLVFIPLEYSIYPAGFMTALTYFYIFYGPIYLNRHMMERAEEISE
ncbi:MAG: CDP-alcohol phosphatidyltransferase family protein [Asgard group archaeon]|nr:CDP-alcohol phosphatidyltransferase family protein [Asgard group archaeon]